MGKRHVPSIEALTSTDDDLLITELRLSEAREHVAIARDLLEEVDRLVRLSATDQVSAVGQGASELVAEELARLGCKIVEVASALSRTRGPEANDWQPLRIATG
jgi:hypothetical protein